LIQFGRVDAMRTISSATTIVSPSMILAGPVRDFDRHVNVKIAASLVVTNLNMQCCTPIFSQASI
jgi:hypothetical protein